MAETGYAKGEMEHVFLKDDKEMCKRVSIIAAMIIRYETVTFGNDNKIQGDFLFIFPGIQKH